MFIAHLPSTLRRGPRPISDGVVDAVGDGRSLRRFGYLVCFVLATAVFALFRLRGLPLTPEGVREAVLGWGALAPIVFVLLVTARPLVYFPSTLLFIGAGLAFGPLLGTLYAALGGTSAAVITFVLARWLGREFVQAHLPARWRRFHDEEWGAGLVFFLNLVPIVPTTAVNYGAGLSRIPLPQYTVAVIAGLTPRILAYSYFGDSLLDVGSRQFVLAIAVIVFLVIVPIYLRRRWRSGKKV